MSQNYYIPNMYGLNRGLSEVSNYSTPSINYPLQTNQMVSNIWLPTSNSEFLNMPTFCSNPEQFQPLIMPSGLNFEYKKENLSCGAFKRQESVPKLENKVNLLNTLWAKSPVIESSSITNPSKSNEISSENKK